jgi:type I restriction enzyme S subunit
MQELLGIRNEGEGMGIGNEELGMRNCGAGAKKVPRRRLPGFSGEWVEKRLGEICEIIMGQSPASVNYNINGDGLPLIQGNADLENRKSIIRFYTSQITKICDVGDVVLSVRAPVGAVGKVEYKSCLGRGVCALKYENDFLYQYLLFVEDKWGEFSKGSTFDSINSNELAEYKLPLPPTVAEQRAIAEVLSDMDAEIEALEAKRAKYESIKQGMMQELLTGKTRLKGV